MSSHCEIPPAAQAVIALSAALNWMTSGHKPSSATSDLNFNPGCERNIGVNAIFYLREDVDQAPSILKFPCALLLLDIFFFPATLLTMKLGVKLRTLEHVKQEDLIGETRMDLTSSQLIVSIMTDNDSHQPIIVLEDIWANIVQASEGDSELVLKLSKAGGNISESNPNQCIYLREFSEAENHAARFTAILTALRLMIQNLKRESITTLRDIYYRDVTAFQGSQRRLNEALKMISASLGFSLERDLKIAPSPKGLVFGGPRIRLTLDTNTILELTYDRECALVPASVSENSLFASENVVDAIIISEKEAVFKSFSAFLLASAYQHAIIMLTGKGNPDMASTRFTKALRKSFTGVPVFVFVDSDVYGLRILWTYMLAAGGPTSCVVFAGTYLLEHERGYLTIARREWKLMTNFLKEICLYEKEQVCMPAKSLTLIKRELTRGMLLGVKAELNVICNSSQDDGLNTYMWEKVAQAIGKT